jgi:uncharacterized protein (DUF1501 family)
MRKTFDSNIRRRAFLQGMAGAAFLAAFNPFHVSFAMAPGDQRFVFVILRGAMDGLAAVPPYGDRSYAAARGTMALPASAYTPLDATFGLHKSFSAFGDLFARKEAAIVHAVATPYRERSHFDAQNVLECGAARPHGLNDGWLNRALAVIGTKSDKLGLAVGETIPLALQGGVPVASWAPASQGLPPDALLLTLEKLYARDAVFHSALSQAVNIHDIAGDGMRGARGGGNPRNRQAMAETTAAVGKILSAQDGPRIATIEIGGWDTHAQQGAESGLLANNFALLDDVFKGLKDALGPLWQKTAVMAATEFGRTVAGNGTGGTDHGTASCLLLAGGAVNGGRVLGAWPGLDKTQLYEGRDLRPTSDMRQVAKAILQDHLHLPAAEVEKTVFPQSTSAHAAENLIRPT